MKDSVAVVGAGIAGRLLALKLRRYGYQVTMFARELASDKTTCSFAAAGLLTPYSEGAAASDPAMVELAVDARQRWADLLATLEAPVVLGQNGSLLVSYPQDLAGTQELLGRLRRRFPQVACELVDRDRLVQLEPELREAAVSAGIYLPSEGYVQSHQALDALQQALDLEGVVSHYATDVLELLPHQLTTPGGSRRFDLIFDCRGFAARGELHDLRGVRGELIEVFAPEVQLALPLQVLHLRYPTYIVPRGHDRYAIGATCLESESVAPVTVKSALELLGAAYQLHPGFRFAQIVRMVAHCRPAFSNHLPQVHTAPGLWRINGLYRHGFLLGPIVSDLVMAKLTNSPFVCNQDIFQPVAA